MAPVPLKEENKEAKDMVRSLFTSTVSEENIELLLRTVLSANQLSVYGANGRSVQGTIPRFCSFRGKPVAPDRLETMDSPTGSSIAGRHTKEQQQGNLVQDSESRFEQLSGHRLERKDGFSRIRESVKSWT